jgi:hypothetical protein
MKKIILIVSLLSLGGLYNQSPAQCTFGNVGVKINSAYTDPTTQKCVINFDLYFDVEHNPGGKYFWIHIWPTSNYPNYSYPQSQPPTTSQILNGNGTLDNSIMTFGYFHQQGALTPQLFYPPDANVPGFQTGYTLSEIQGTPDRYTAHGLSLTLPQGCNIAQSLTADLWESQSDHAQTIACFSKNQPFYVNDPTIVNGLLFCQLPRTYKFDINTLSAIPKTVNYQVRIDYDGNGIFNPLTDTPIIKSGTATITNASPFQSGIQSYLPYSNVKLYADKALWVVVLKNGIDLPNDIYARIDNGCAPLPVQFMSFSAMRNKNNVTIKWVTATEINNRGFYIERKNGNTDWQIINFISSRAINGNSADELQYSFIDNNNLTGVSLYRLRQVDMDNKLTYSDIRMVKGIDQSSGVIVFPNPSADGQFTIVLDNYYEGSVIKLVDMNGRSIKEWSNVTTGKLIVNNVSAGMYMLQIWQKAINESQVIKVIVSK